MHLLSNLHTQSSLFMEKKKIYCRSFFYLYLPSLSLKAEGLQKYWCSQITSRFDSAKKFHCSNMISILSHTRNLNLKVIAKYAVRSQPKWQKSIVACVSLTLYNRVVRDIAQYLSTLNILRPNSMRATYGVKKKDEKCTNKNNRRRAQMKK